MTLKTRRASRRIWVNHWDVFRAGCSILVSESRPTRAWRAPAGALWDENEQMLGAATWVAGTGEEIVGISSDLPLQCRISRVRLNSQGSIPSSHKSLQRGWCQFTSEASWFGLVLSHQLSAFLRPHSWTFVRNVWFSGRWTWWSWNFHPALTILGL